MSGGFPQRRSRGRGLGLAQGSATVSTLSKQTYNGSFHWSWSCVHLVSPHLIHTVINQANNSLTISQSPAVSGCICENTMGNWMPQHYSYQGIRTPLKFVFMVQFWPDYVKFMSPCSVWWWSKEQLWQKFLCFNFQTNLCFIYSSLSNLQLHSVAVSGRETHLPGKSLAVWTQSKH